MFPIGESGISDKQRYSVRVVTEEVDYRDTGQEKPAPSPLETWIMHMTRAVAMQGNAPGEDRFRRRLSLGRREWKKRDHDTRDHKIIKTGKLTSRHTLASAYQYSPRDRENVQLLYSRKRNTT